MKELGRKFTKKKEKMSQVYKKILKNITNLQKKVG